MKQNMKRLWLVLCMVACLFSLSACAAAEVEAEEVDPTITMIVSVSAESALTDITSLSDEELAEQIALYEKNEVYFLSEGFSAWANVKAETGAFVEVLGTNVQKEEKGYSGTITAKFEKRNLEFKMMVTKAVVVDGDPAKGPDITSISFNPEYTMAEKMQKAGLNTLMGIGTVFTVLVFIIFIISLFKYINVFENKMKAKSEAAAVAAPAVPEAVAAAPAAAEMETEAELVDDLELVAVITAAIAASANTSTDGLVVRSIKRASGATWKRA